MFRATIKVQIRLPDKPTVRCLHLTAIHTSAMISFFVENLHLVEIDCANMDLILWLCLALRHGCFVVALTEHPRPMNRRRHLNECASVWDVQISVYCLHECLVCATMSCRPLMPPGASGRARTHALHVPIIAYVHVLSPGLEPPGRRSGPSPSGCMCGNSLCEIRVQDTTCSGCW